VALSLRIQIEKGGFGDLAMPEKTESETKMTGKRGKWH